MNMNICELTENDPIYLETINSQIALKKHQLCSLKKCISIENEMYKDDNYCSVYSNIGLLGDKPGSGKSYVILALIAVNEVPLNVIKPVNVYSDAIYIENRSTDLKYLKINIIVCPFSIIEQWSTYIKTFNKNINFYIINTTKSLNQFQNIDKKEQLILLVSSTFYYLVEEYLNSNHVMVSRVIFDEADSATTRNAKRIPAKFYWFVSASYTNVIYPYQKFVATLNSQNRYINRVVSSGVHNNVFIKNLFGNLLRCLPFKDRSILHKFIVKNSDDFVIKSFRLPDINQYYIICSDTVSDLINCMTTNENIISCINAGDLDTAISHMNRTNKGNEKHIIDIMKQDLNNNLTNCRLNIKYQSEIIVDDKTAQTNKIMQLEEQELDILNKIKMIEERIKYGDICTICYSDFTNKTIIKCCKNAICFECICTWLQVKKFCPYCKHTLNDIHNDLYVIHDNEGKKHKEIHKKLETLSLLMDHIVSSKKDSKILIFAEYEKPLTDVIPILNDKKIKYGLLKGTKLKGNIDKYKNSDTDVLLINSKAFGSGINLENTTDLIIYHTFNESVQSQVIGRAQRPGRKHPLNVWYLFNNGELEKNRTKQITEFTL